MRRDGEVSMAACRVRVDITPLTVIAEADGFKDIVVPDTVNAGPPAVRVCPTIK